MSKITYIDDYFFDDLIQQNEQDLTESDILYLFEHENYRKMFLQKIRNALKINEIEYNLLDKRFIVILYNSLDNDSNEVVVSELKRDFELDVCGVETIDVSVTKAEYKMLRLYQTIDVLLSLVFYPLNTSFKFEGVKVYYVDNNIKDNLLVLSYKF